MLLKDIMRILTDAELMRGFAEGLLHTFIITVIAAAMGLVLGFLVAIVKIAGASLKENKWLLLPRLVAELYTTVIRGTPVALQLFIMVFAVFAIPGFKVYAVILTFGINSGAYVSESIRAGIASVDPGQMEAGRALGLSWGTTMRRVILPQAVKNIIPAIGNEMIALLKETAIVSLVGSTIGTLTFDLNAAADMAAVRTADYLAGGIVAAALYLIVVYLMVFVIGIIEKRLKRSER